MTNGKRVEILLEIGMLEDEHCANCELVTHQHMEAYNKNKYCHSICNIGLKMQELGKGLKLREPEPPPPKKKTKTSTVIDLHLKGFSNREITEITGYNNKMISTAVSRYRRRNNLPSAMELKEMEVKELIKKGNSMSDIRKITGYSKGYIYKMIKVVQNDGKNITD